MMKDYFIFDPKIDRPLHELSRSEAEAAFKWFMSQKDFRKTQLTEHAKRNGAILEGTSKEIVEGFHQFFVSEIRKEKPGDKPSSYIYSLCNDLAVLVSDLLIENAPQLSWKMHTSGKNDLSYQRPVISGFKVKNKNFGLDIDYLLCQYAHRLCKNGEAEVNFLWKIFISALEIA